MARGHQGRLMPTRPHRAATPGGRTWGPARPQHPAGQRGPGPAPAHTASRGRRARLLVWPGPPHGPSWGPLCPPCPTRGDSGNPGPHPNTRARSRHTHTCRMRTHRHAHQCTHTTWVPWFCATSRDPGTGLLPHEKPRLAGPAGTPAPEAGAPHSSRPGSPRPPPRPRPPQGSGRLPGGLPTPCREPDADQLPRRPGQAVQSRRWADVPARPSAGPAALTLGLRALGPSGVRPGGGARRGQGLTRPGGGDTVRGRKCACAGCRSATEAARGAVNLGLPPRQTHARETEAQAAPGTLPTAGPLPARPCPLLLPGHRSFGGRDPSGSAPRADHAGTRDPDTANLSGPPVPPAPGGCFTHPRTPAPRPEPPGACPLPPATTSGHSHCPPNPAQPFLPPRATLSRGPGTKPRVSGGGAPHGLAHGRRQLWAQLRQGAGSAGLGRPGGRAVLRGPASGAQGQGRSRPRWGPTRLHPRPG